MDKRLAFERYNPSDSFCTFFSESEGKTSKHRLLHAHKGCIYLFNPKYLIMRHWRLMLNIQLRSQE